MNGVVGFASIFVGLAQVFGYVIAFELLWSVMIEDSAGDDADF